MKVLTIVVVAVAVVVAVVAGTYLFVVAPEGDDREPSLPADDAVEKADPPDAPAEKASVRLSAGQSGELTHDSGARIEIPEGALLGAAAVSIVEVEPPPSPVEVGKVYDFSVGERPILSPLTLHIPYELEPGANDSQIVPLHWDEDLEVWTALEGEVDSASRTVAVTVSDLSFFSTIGGKASGSGRRSSGVEPRAVPRIVKVEVPRTVLVNEPIQVDWHVQNEGPSDLSEVDEDAVGYVRLTSPGPEEEKLRLEASHGLLGLSRDWRSGVTYSWARQRLSDEDRHFTIVPDGLGPVTVRVELVFEGGDGEVIGRDTLEREVHVTTHRGISPTTVVEVDGREYRVSGEPNAENGIDYAVEDVRDSSRVDGTLKDKAVFTAHVQQSYQTSRSKRAARFAGIVDVLIGLHQTGADISAALPTILRGARDIGIIMMAPSLDAKLSGLTSLGTLALIETIKEIGDHPEDFTHHTARQAMHNSREFVKDIFDLTKDVQDGRALSFDEAMELKNWQAYVDTHYKPAHDALLKIVVSNFSSNARDQLTEEVAEQVAHLSGLPVVEFIDLEEILSVLHELEEPLSEYEPWSLMQGGIQAKMAEERAEYERLLNSLAISDIDSLRLPVLTRIVVPEGEGPSLSPAPAWTLPPASSSGRIAFMSNRDGNDEIYVMNADGSGVTRLTDNEETDGSPRWSPDGRRIAFDSNRDGNGEIYVMNADGSGVTRLTDNEAEDWFPRWSPDGRRIAFTSYRDGNDEIYVMNADGSGVTRLTDNRANDRHPRWSPDGRRIAFDSNRDGNSEIYVINADGSGVTRLTDTEGHNAYPSWSPDGRRIAFESNRDGNDEIYVMNADGSGVTRLTDNRANDRHPRWSPDGRRIAFNSTRDGNSEIYVTNADGSGVTRLTDTEGHNAYPSWSPDGRRIAFNATRDGNDEIYVMNADGSGVTRLTDNEARDHYSSWSPAVSGESSTPATSATENSETPASSSGRIAFMSIRDGNWEIYVINADGSGVTRLTDTEGHNAYPSWSPDGRRIAFESNRDGNDEIYVMNADGSGVTRLTDNRANDRHPRWSPDGRRIAFNSTRDGNSEIYVTNADGSGVTRLTDTEGHNAYPSWSPDGRRIAFNSTRDGNSEIYVMNADGSGVTRLTDNEARGWGPRWSPDGRRIAFNSTRDGNSEIYVTNADGSGVTRLTDNEARGGGPTWSPDGRRIAFESNRDGNWEIYVINADGSGVTRLTDNEARDLAPSWSPDGRRIAFNSNRDGNSEIYVMNADGSGVIRLTDNEASDHYSSWSPDPS